MDTEGGNRWTLPHGLREAGLGAWYTIGLLVCLAGILAVFAILRTVTIPLVLGVLFGIVAFPFTDYLTQHRIKRALAGGLVSLLFVAILLGIGYLVLSELVGQGEVIAENLNKAAADVESAAGEGSAIADAVADLTQSIKDNWRDLLRGLVPMVGGALQSLGLLAFVGFLTVNVFFLVQQYGRAYKHWTARHLTVPLPLAEGILSDGVRSVRGYFVGSAVVGLENAVVLGLAALVLGTPVPFVIAVVAFLFSFVPFIGAIITGVFAVLMALAGGGPTDALIMLMFVIIANGVLQTIVQQIALGSTLNLNPLVVLVASVVGSIIAGPVGGMIACPLTAVAVMATARIRQAGLTGSDVPEDTSTELDTGRSPGDDKGGDSGRPAVETSSA